MAVGLGNDSNQKGLATMLKASAVSSSVEDNLRLAMSIELATLPTYLYTYWSIRPREEGGSEAGVLAARGLRSIIFEEMLHLGLAANVLNSLGGPVALTSGVPSYPGSLPGHVTTGPYAFTVHLQPLSWSAVDMMMKIELPAWDTTGTSSSDGWVTLGQFYETIIAQLNALPPNSFNPVLQLPSHDNPSPGRLLSVDSLDTAIGALRTIMAQGEGLSPTHDKDGFHELAHYSKLQKIQNGIQQGLIDLDRDVHPVIVDPFESAYNAAQKEANQRFNRIYSALLDSLQATMSGKGPTEVFGPPTQLMNDLGHAAAYLRSLGHVPGTNRLAGPTFEYTPTQNQKAR